MNASPVRTDADRRTLARPRHDSRPVLRSAHREKIDHGDPPRPLPGIPVALLARVGLILTLQTAILAPAACGRPITDEASLQHKPNPISEQPIEDPSGKAMLAFYSALTRSLTKCDRPECQSVTRIFHYGDSHAASGLFTGPLRRSFQRDFGDAGPGFMLAGRPWSWYRPFEAEAHTSAGWRTEGLAQADLLTDGRHGLSGLSFSSEQPGQTITVTADCKLFDVYFLKQPGAGLIDIYLDGAIFTRRLSLSSNRSEASYVSVAPPARGTHTIEIRTLAPAPVRILGIAAERGTSGVEYDVLGINGARAYRPLQWDWNVMASNLARRRPNLIVVAYGSNEVADQDLDLNDYRGQFARLLSSFRRAAPQASLLVIAPPERSALVHGVWRPHENMPSLVEAQRQAAFSQGAAFWNLYAAMGGQGSIEHWANAAEPLAQRDRVHLTALGYSLAAEALYREIIHGYLRAVWKAIQTVPRAVATGRRSRTSMDVGHSRAATVR